MAFPRAAAVAEVGWSPAASLDWNDFVRRLPQQMSLYQALNIHAFGEPTEPAEAAEPTEPLLRRSSHQLASCTNKILLSLEDDAPVSGDRPAFMVDILNPCWIFKEADLGRVTGFAAAVGQVPFQFELGAGVYLPKLDRPVTASGELEVRVDGCEADVIARMPLQPAVGNDGVTELPPVKTTPRAGRHDVCLKFAQWVPDPLWVINWFQLVE
jgi:hexosaminidase